MKMPPVFSSCVLVALRHHVCFHGKPIRNSDALFGHAGMPPVAVAYPLGNIELAPVREITQFQSKSESLYHNAPRPPKGGARGGLYAKNEVFYRAYFLKIYLIRDVFF